eukprot:326848-Prorocentrum_minimum.AAC.1
MSAPAPPREAGPEVGDGRSGSLLRAAWREPIAGEASAYSRRGSQSWERRQHIPAAGANRGRG